MPLAILSVDDTKFWLSVAMAFACKKASIISANVVGEEKYFPPVALAIVTKGPVGEAEP